MMSTTTTAGAAAPLTTAFSAPTSCIGNFNSTVTHSTGVVSPESTVALVSYPATAPGCQPSAPGWNATVQRLDPGVCPSDWTAYDLGVSNTLETASKSVTFSATCCSSGFTPNYDYQVPRVSQGRCVKDAGATTNVNGSIPVTTISVHAPWEVRWMYSDTSTLSPPPPSMKLCSHVQISTWVPGSKVDKSDREDCIKLGETDSTHQYDGVIILIVVLASVFGGGAVLCCIMCCVCGHRMKKKRRIAALQQQQQQQQQEHGEAGNELAPVAPGQDKS